MADDPVKVAPKIYKVLLENSRVPVLEARLRPGDKASMHSATGRVLDSLGGGAVSGTRA